MSKKYSYPCNLVRGSFETKILSVTQVANAIALTETSKGVHISNEGANTAYITFDTESVTISSYPVRAGETEHFPYAQVDKINAICDSGATAEIRIFSEY